MTTTRLQVHVHVHMARHTVPPTIPPPPLSLSLSLSPSLSPLRLTVINFTDMKNDLAVYGYGVVQERELHSLGVGDKHTWVLKP